MKRILGFLLSILILMVSMIPMSVFAETDTVNIDPDVIVDSEGIIYAEVNLELSGDDIAKVIIEKSLNAIAAKDPTGIAKWGVGQLISGLFPTEKDTTLQDMQKMLEEGIQRLDELQRSVNKLSDQMSLTEIYDCLNEYSFYVNSCIVPIKPLITTLASFDSDTAEDQGNDSQLAQNRRKVLTKSIGLNADNMGTVNEVAFDQNYYYLYGLITTKYKVDVSGESKELDLFQMYREGMRYLHDWENQAWDDMDAYNVSLMNTYLSYATLRLESLDARKYELKASEEKEDEHKAEITVIENEIANVQEQVAKVGELYENAIVDRDADYRYFWKPGYEAMFNANLYDMTQVQEKESMVSATKDMNGVIQSQREDDRLKKAEALVYQCPDSGKGWPASFGYANESADRTYDVWYASEGKYNATDMASTDDYNNLLNAYAYKKSIGEILQEGEFKLGNDTFVNDEKAIFMINKSDAANPAKLNKYLYGHKQCISEYSYFQPTAYGVKSIQKASVSKGKATQFFKYRYFHMIDWIPELGKIKKEIWTIDDASSACGLTPYVLQRYQKPASTAPVMSAAPAATPAAAPAQTEDGNGPSSYGVIIIVALLVVAAFGYGFIRSRKNNHNRE